MRSSSHAAQLGERLVALHHALLHAVRVGPLVHDVPGLVGHALRRLGRGVLAEQVDDLQLERLDLRGRVARRQLRQRVVGGLAPERGGDQQPVSQRVRAAVAHPPLAPAENIRRDPMSPDPDFARLASAADPPIEELALAMAAELRETDREAARERLDELGEQLASLASGGSAELEAWACAELLGGREGLSGDREEYDNPDNSMLDLVLERRRGLPIALSVVYVAAARRAGIEQLAGVGLPGHFVVAHFGASPPLVLDPFSGGVRVSVQGPARLMRPWTPHETALRMLNNLVAAYTRRARLD